MLPKRGRREITIDNILYHYFIKQTGSQTRVVIRNSEDGRLSQWHCDDECSITPKDVEEIIRENKTKVKGE